MARVQLRQKEDYYGKLVNSVCHTMDAAVIATGQLSLILKKGKDQDRSRLCSTAVWLWQEFRKTPRHRLDGALTHVNRKPQAVKKSESVS